MGSPWDTAPSAMPTVLPHLPALPIRIVKPLRDKTVLARHKATLECTVSHARGRVRWLRGDTEIFAGDKYEICNLDCYRTLIIHRVGPEDEDSYTCDAFDDRSTARLLVEGNEAHGGAHWGLWVLSSLAVEGRWGPCSHIPLLAKVCTLGSGEQAGHGTRGLCPPLLGHSFSGAPPAPGILSSPLFLLSLQGGRSQDVLFRGCTEADERHCWEMGSCFPSDVQTHGHHSQPALASRLCIKQHFFFLTWLLPSQQDGVPLGERVVAPLGILPSIPGEPCPRHPPSPLHSLWSHTPDSERLFTVWLWPQQHLAHLQKRLKRGTAAWRCRDGGTWQKRAIPGAVGLAGLRRGSQSRGAPWSSLTTILPAWPRGNPGSLCNKLIQIIARELYTRREPLPVAPLWGSCPVLRLGPASAFPLATIKSSRQQNSDSF